MVYGEQRISPFTLLAIRLNVFILAFNPLAIWLNGAG